MNLIGQASAGTKKALSVQNIVFMVITTLLVSLILSGVLKNEIVIYDTKGKITGYGDINPRLKAPKFEEEEKNN